MSITGTAPEQGQLVHLRNRYFIVEDVISKMKSDPVLRSEDEGQVKTS